MSPTLRRIVFVAAGLAALAVVVFLLSPDPVAVEVAVVDRGPLEVTVDEDGRTRVRDRYTISAPVTGRMERLMCEAGDPVAEGEVLALIHPLPLDTRAQEQAVERLRGAEATRDAARARLEQAETARARARRTLERLQQVHDELRGAVAEQRLDDARSAERTAAAAAEEAARGLDAAQHEVAAARAALSGTTATPGAPTRVSSPVAGRVLRTHEECERVITAGSPLVEVGDPGSLEVVVDLLTDDAVRVTDGAPARVEVGGERTLGGVVERVEPSAFTRISPLGVEEQRVNVVVRLAEDGLGDGGASSGDDAAAPTPPVLLGDRYRVEVSLVVWRADDVVRVPVSALFRREAGWGVFVVRGDRAEARAVEIDHRGRQYAEVVRGLSPGDVVVRFPPEALGDGAAVRIRSGGG